MKLNKEITPDDILQYILDFDSKKTGTYIILGKPGPTGKTYICKNLVNFGYNAIEISEGIALSNAIEYKDDSNHIVELPFGNTIIILNQRITARFYESHKSIGVKGKAPVKKK